MRGIAASVAMIVSVLVASGCASSGKEATTHINDGVARVCVSCLQQHVVQVARSSDRSFSIFPAVPSKRRCAIPEGGPAPHARVLHGMCETSIRSAQTHEPAWHVTFTERWHTACPPPDLMVACRHRWHRHTWRILEGEPIIKPGADINVYATRSSGATAPQDYQ